MASRFDGRRERFVTWLVLTVLAVSTARQPWVRRNLLREMVGLSKTHPKSPVP